MKLQRTVLATSITLAFSGAALAEPPAGTPYHADPQHSYVHDQSSEAIGTVNMITCFFGAMNPAELVNQPAYRALVDESKCDENRRSSANNSDTSSGSSGAPDYTDATVQSVRQSANDPMTIKAWLHQREEGRDATIYVRVTATAAPTTANPNGDFRLEFCGVDAANPACQFQGYLAGSPTGMQFVERESRDGRTGSRRVYLTGAGAESGAGAIESDQPRDGGGNVLSRFQFAYNATHFLRSDGNGTDVCFDRSLENSDKSVWRYGLYDHQGNRVERNSGFPIKFGNHHGYAGYHGVNLPPEGMQALTTGSIVERQSFGDGGATATPYEVTRARGRLLKYTAGTTELANLNKVRFHFMPFAGLEAGTRTAIVANSTDESIRRVMLEAYYDSEANTFRVSGFQNCDQNGCAIRLVQPAVPFTPPDLVRYTTSGIQGYSQSFGGPIAFPSETVNDIAGLVQNVGNRPVKFRTESLVYPGTPGAPTELACVSDCPTPAQITTFATAPQAPNATPFTLQRSPTGAEIPVAYTYDAQSGHLQLGADAVVFGPGVTGETLTGTRFGNGVRSGRLVPPAALAGLNCPPPDQNNFCEFGIDAIDSFYVWEFGVNPWNQFVGLRQPGTPNFVQFDAPLQVTYLVPNRTEFGVHAGAVLRLSYNGFGELHGIPGHCVNPVNNQPTDCGGPGNKRYVPHFAIPQHPVEGIVSVDENTNYFVKWLEREVRFARDTTPGACSALTLGSLANLPSLAGLRNPADPADPAYIGAEPATPDAPRVIHGVTQGTVTPVVPTGAQTGTQQPQNQQIRF